MLGTIVNVAAIVAGGLAGIWIGGSFKERYKNTIMQGISLSVVVIGLSMALKGENTLLTILSLVIGGLIGEMVNIEAKLDGFGQWIQERLQKNGKVSNFSKGFVIASLVYCVGSMSIVGAIQDGILHDPSTLYAKAVLDGISAIVFASTMGMGVIFSFIPVFVYQGSITLLASYIQPVLTDAIVTEMTAVGGVLILGIALTMLDIKKIKVGNLLPSIFIPIIYGLIVNFL
ncbi:MAG: DUF554 domain-containing protein [Clostridiaceae bacterium]|nr:DUF554 domain-containing protein [Clostridiaceae bacterium]